MTTFAPTALPAFYSVAFASRRGAADRARLATVAMFTLVAVVAILGLAAAISHAVVPPISIDDLSPLLGL